MLHATKRLSKSFNAKETYSDIEGKIGKRLKPFVGKAKLNEWDLANHNLSKSTRG